MRTERYVLDAVLTAVDGWSVARDEMRARYRAAESGESDEGYPDLAADSQSLNEWGADLLLALAFAVRADRSAGGAR